MIVLSSYNFEYVVGLSALRPAVMKKFNTTIAKKRSSFF
ncbi:hypothetical protein DJ66_1250 [Candidatus Liberibacter solanacearum]|uniref:Uncharacterized protein n=1 Tax=Candidatus Liberibacter solanacearum TaxID=556287 RepID=A0A0F4VIS7_9HYPH|nr:hypothetical protein DJ66_1250 [Candidatus Liberibacter solanacearum]